MTMLKSPIQHTSFFDWNPAIVTNTTYNNQTGQRMTTNYYH